MELCKKTNYFFDYLFNVFSFFFKKQIGRESRELNYTVVEELDKLQSLSLKIEELSSEIAEGLEVFKCVKGEIQRTSSFFGSWFSFSSSYDWMLPFSFAFNLLVVLLVILLKRKTPKKLKIN